MYGLRELKTQIKIDNNSVECPLKGCSEKVERQRISFKKELKSQCPKHKIFISPSTFEYENEVENLLWYDNADKSLYDEIIKFKRESRMARDNSEDALTWNVMRFLEKQGYLKDFLSQLSNMEINEVDLILWSYSLKEKSNWSFLNDARNEFGETVSRGSEPDIIIKTDKVLYFIESKLKATNKTLPSNPLNLKKYESGGNSLFQKIFKFDFDTIAVKEKRYELLRFWLLGSWIANKLMLDFEFISLVKQSHEKIIETEFRKLIIENPKRKFSRLTWEQIYDYIKKLSDNNDKQKMTDYFENKTIGFNSNGNIIKAFNIIK